MGTVSIVLGIIGICISWLPAIGWSGVLFGIVGWVLGILSVTHWHRKPGYTGWGISGIVLGGSSASLSLAYQIKHAAGALDALHVPLSAPFAAGVMITAAMVTALAMILARVKGKTIGVVLASLAVAIMSLSGAWALTTADRDLGVISSEP